MQAINRDKAVAKKLKIGASSWEFYGTLQASTQKKSVKGEPICHQAGTTIGHCRWLLSLTILLDSRVG